MSIVILAAALITSATVAFVAITKGTPEPTVASMLRRRDLKESDTR
jgi:predicted aconitase